MYSLSHTKVPVILNRYLDLSLQEKFVRSQDAHMLIAQIAHNPSARELTYKFVVKKWDVLLERYHNEGKALGRILQAVFAPGKTAKDFARAEQFFATHHF